MKMKKNILTDTELEYWIKALCQLYFVVSTLSEDSKIHGINSTEFVRLTGHQKDDFISRYVIVYFQNNLII